MNTCAGRALYTTAPTTIRRGCPSRPLCRPCLGTKVAPRQPEAARIRSGGAVTSHVSLVHRQISRCLIPGFDGAAFSREWKDAYGPSSARERHDGSGSPSSVQHSQAGLRALAARYGVDPKTVAKWKKRSSVADRKTGPTEPRSTVLSAENEAVIVAFRRHTLLPLDDCLYAFQPTIPHLTRSSLHRCLQRHGISRLPEVGGDKPLRAKFKRYPIGYFHIDIAEVHIEEGRLYLLVAIGPPSSPSPSCTRRSRAGSPAICCGPLLPPFPIRSTPCSPITPRVSYNCRSSNLCC